MVKVIKERVKSEGNHETLNASCYFLFVVVVFICKKGSWPRETKSIRIKPTNWPVPLIKSRQN